MLAQRLTLAAVVVITSTLWIEPETRRSLGYGYGVRQAAERTLAQRYPLRARSTNFANRSKISYTRGK